jgi:hypothetical protein
MCFITALFLLPSAQLSLERPPRLAPGMNPGEDP